MNKIIKFLSFALIAVAITACNSNENTTSSRTFSACFASAKDVTTGTTVGCDGVIYQLDLNYTIGTAKVTISCLKLGDKTYSDIVIDEVPFKVNTDGWLEIAPAKASVSTAKGANVTYLNIKTRNRNVSGGIYPDLIITYTLDDRFEVLSSTQMQYEEGKTTSTYSGGSFQTANTQYILGINSKPGTINMMMQGAQFIDKMPAMNIKLTDVPFRTHGTSLIFEAEEIIPSIGDTPYPGFKLTNVHGELNLAKGLTLTFNCKPETMPFDFTVNADCNYDTPIITD